jgi:hypothetical protein
MFSNATTKSLRLLYRVICWCVAVACGAIPSVLADEIDYAVMISATPQTNPPQITLTWPAHADATDYRILRKLTTGTTFTTIADIYTGAATANIYVDTTAAVGVPYEYAIRRRISTDTLFGRGYIAAGINLPLVENRGKLILLVDETMAAPLAPELMRLEADLRGDGWTVLRRDVSRTAAVPSVKELITSAYAADPTTVKAVFLFGRIPVPYSGDTFPDGHTPDHRGAWPADCYYGDINGTWTDTSVTSTGSSAYGNRNHNVPGDGKFDQSSMQGGGNARIELIVARVDLSSLPAFKKLSEADLLRRYLNKDHAWRHGALIVDRRGLVDENFNGVEKHATGGFMTLGALVGAAETSVLDYTSTLSDNAYLVSYGDGPGSTTSCSGVATSGNFVANDYRTVFTFLYGSYFGDWDSANNLLRAALGSPTYTLASTWGGRPYPAYHTLGIGDPIGAGVRMTQNLSGNDGGDIYRPPFTTNYTYDSGIHIALMGDPTLRLHPVKPVTNLQQATSPSQIVLTWSASTDSSIVGYHVYRAASPTAPMTRLTGVTVTAMNPDGSPIAETGYTDTTVEDASHYYYMVRAVKLETSNSATYYNLSQGAFITNAPPVIFENQSFSSTAGTAFSYQVLASNDPSSYVHVEGALPAGVTFDTATGLLSGTPTVAGTYPLSFTASNSGGTSAAATLTLTVVMPPIPVVAANQTASGYRESAFRYQILASSSPANYQLTSGSLPPGVTLDPTTGLLTGTPLSGGTFTPEFTATNIAGTSEPVAVALTIYHSLGLAIYEPFAYPLGTNNPDVDAGANGGSGLPYTNEGGDPSGTGTGLRGSWGTSTDVVGGLSYSQGTKVLSTSGNAGLVNNATWGTGNPFIYRHMVSDPFLFARVSDGGNIGREDTSVYVSFLGRTNSADEAAFRLDLRFDNSNNFYVSNTATGWSLHGTAAKDAPLALNTSTLFVVRFDFAFGATTVSLWINPPLGEPLGRPNAVVPNRNFPGLGNFSTNSTTANAMSFDELRVGTSLAAVTPFTIATIPSAPSGLTAVATSSSQINLSWTDNSTGETGFKLERSADGSTGWTEIATPAADAVSGSDTGLATTTAYYYRLRATNVAGDSTYSEIAHATTLNGVQRFRFANALAKDGSQDLLAPAGDGIANLLKYAFNMLGTGSGQVASLETPNASLLTVSGTAGMPLVGVGRDSDAGKLQLTYIRRKAASSPGISYSVEFSDELATWAANASAVESVTSIDTTFDRVTVTDSTISSAQRFVRVRVSAF